MTPPPITVLIVDDHPVVRAGLKAMLNGHGGVTVVADASSGQEAIELTATLKPDVVLCDLRLGEGIDGVAVTKALRRGQPQQPHVVILTTFDLDADIIRAVEAGASGYLLKDAPSSAIVQAIIEAHHGDTVVDGATSRRYVQAARTGAIALTPRETEVLELIAGGQSNKDIARTLLLSEATVKTHVNRILAKLRVENRTAAVATARSAGLIRDREPRS